MSLSRGTSPPRTIWSLDLSGQTGFAVGRGGAVLESGCWPIIKKDSIPGPMYAVRRLAHAMQDLEARHPPDIVVIEEVMDADSAVKIGNRASTVGFMHMLHGGVHFFCAERPHIKAAAVDVRTHRKVTTGKAYWRDPKAESIAAVNAYKLRPYTVTNDNEADALSVFYWASFHFDNILAGKFALRATS